MLAVLFTAGLFLLPGVSAALGFHCLRTMQAISPRRFIENVQQKSCHAQCRPRVEESANYWKELIRGLTEDAAAHIQINSDETREAMAEWMDRVFEDLRGKCGPKLGHSHACEDSEQLQEAMKCVDDNSWVSLARAAPIILPYVSEELCKKVHNYYDSVMWEESFPKRIENYLEHCHDEL